ncbi:hypothetical protein JTE90_025549 [Oedothorax gibbosus]|uniref:DUF4277 domain-containing protein n=1 Tax=Oedothorax gibbosus TaxID=931172 RepID=A0AAV6TWM6_9ARAC|nr:hypothetical protein JTE90_025549 [Oedothorax gibbosus]
MGERVTAMILNGLGFMDNRLYMFPEFLSNKPVDKLFRPDITAEMFNDDALGRCLDAIAEYSPTKLFSQIAFQIGTQFNLLGKTARLDTTTLTVFGDYEQSAANNPASPGADDFKITYGYSKEGRPNLKQMVLNLATTGAGAFLIWMEAHNGNASDKIILQHAAKRMKAFCKQLKAVPAFLFVGDSAMYEKCVADSPVIHWLSKVPAKLNQAKAYLQTPNEAITWQVIENGCKITSSKQLYKGLEQRWLLVYSAQAYASEIAILDRHENIDRFENQFFCKADGEKALALLSKPLRYYDLAVTQVEEVTQYSGQGRPKKDTKPTVIGYKLRTRLVANECRIAVLRSQQGRFILATNQLDNKALSDQEMLQEYKDQHKTEQAFRFIKGNAFEVSLPIFALMALP